MTRPWHCFLACAALLLQVVGTVALTKDELCSVDIDYSKHVLRLVEVAPKAAEPRILCFVNTISVHHSTRVKAVRDTWGQRCTKLIFFSNATDPAYPDIEELDVPADHNHLWQKHKATLAHIWEKYRHDFDWFYKADDDAYVIYENLQAFLRQPHVVMAQDTEPLQFGHRYSLTPDLIDYYVVNKKLLREYQRRTHRWVFNSGGPGYAMNKLYVQKVVESMHDETCLSDRYCEMLPDDAAIAFCMVFHETHPPNTRDLYGRERWHADKPRGIYFTNPDQPDYWIVQYHRDIGGLQWKDDCCSSESIAFHYILPELMYHLERQLYYCRSAAPDLAAYNSDTGLRVSPLILDPKELEVDYGPLPDV
ncbi:glycoprotein-N-acetylgalactosamine 3-beta-galactosyltransferase [Achlya hypogyna]|uniref:N-acetylgalactosaminide beta-1,3-galactosyltransferase n=1 Tax=Achlya hypogyna TaxID=1202772 RepID=A0A0A7CMZ0_ACHHY|nr:secreted protein [Achlya hypogyna]OQR86579.1 glycoprotein-N-acetylgalactosamine 3-beta-galactosyltransferase [Achlya hypogyna]